MYFLTQNATKCPLCKNELKTEGNKKICEYCNMRYDIALIMHDKGGKQNAD